MQTKISRRTVVAGAAAGGVALASAPASAQRCPATPPARTKGLAVWLDYDQHDMDEMYDQSVFAFNQKAVLARSDANNVDCDGNHRRVRALRLWADPIEGVDVWKTKRPNAPVLIYLHGGSWQSGRSAGFRALRRAVRQRRRAFRPRSISPMCGRPRATCFRWSINAAARSHGPIAMPPNSAAIPSGSICAAAPPAAISPAAWSSPNGRSWACRATS